MILLFSGTGNSLHVANILSGRLGDKIIKLPVDGNKVGEVDNGRIVWVFPVYSWGIPPVVARWIRTLELPEAVHHAVMTCGDDIGQADMMWRREIEKRGATTAGAYSVQMPNTYVLMKGFDVDPEEVASQKIESSLRRATEIARRIEKNPTEKITDVVRGAFAWIKTKIIYPYFVRFEMSPRPFHPTTACTGCGTCARVCPMHNISMVKAADSHPEPLWGEDCALCLGCYHACPCHAVAYGNATAKKGQKKLLIS